MSKSQSNKPDQVAQCTSSSAAQKPQSEAQPQLLSPLIDLHRFQKSVARNGFEITGRLPLKVLTRLVESLPEDQPEQTLSVELKISCDHHQVVRLSGTVKALLTHQCQRCLQPFQQPIEVPIDLACFETEEAWTRAKAANRLTDSVDLATDTVLSSASVADEACHALEVVILAAHKVVGVEAVNLAEIIEDDLILALPADPKHPIEAVALGYCEPVSKQKALDLTCSSNEAPSLSAHSTSDPVISGTANDSPSNPQWAEGMAALKNLLSNP